jgi:hypothetical protein
VALGAGDQSAASVGAGLFRPGQAFDSAGTASVFAMCVDGWHPDTKNRVVMATHSVVPETYIALAFINGGGLGLRWFRDEVARLGDDQEAYKRLDEMAAGVPAGSDGLLWWPHIQGRVLPPQPYVRGSWVGLTSGHSLGHMFRSVLEGIAYEYAEWARLAPAATLHEARVLGGGAASALWNQIKADVLGIEWVPTLRPECGVLGDALIAAAATGYIKDPAETALEWRLPTRSGPRRSGTRSMDGCGKRTVFLPSRSLPFSKRWGIAGEWHGSDGAVPVSGVVAVTPRSFRSTPGAHRDLLAGSGLEVRLPSGSGIQDESEMVELVRGCDALIVGLDPVTQSVLDAGPLRAVVKYGTGLDNIDVDARTAAGWRSPRRRSPTPWRWRSSLSG